MTAILPRPQCVNQKIPDLALIRGKDDIDSKQELRTHIQFQDALNPGNYAMSIMSRQKRALAA